MRFELRARLMAEFLGTAFLVADVVGSGIMGERLAGGNVAIALLANTIATGAALVALILHFGPISGAHFNPAVTLADAMERGISWREEPYMSHAICGRNWRRIVAHLMFGLRWYSLSPHARSGWAIVLSEFVATFGLFGDLGLLAVAARSGAVRGRKLHHGSLLVYGINLVCKSGGHDCAGCIGYLCGDSAVGCSLFMIAQFAGALAATFLFRWLVPNLKAFADEVVVPHSGANPTE